MQIIMCDASRDAAWNEFVRQSPRASFYHRAEWRGINESCFGHETAYLAALENGRITGVLPLVRLKSFLFGNIACSMPFVNYGGPCGETSAIENALLEAASGVLDEWGSEYLEIRSRHLLDERYPFSDHKVSMTVTLEGNPELFWSGFKSGHAKEIRRAYKRGYIARFGGVELADDFYAVLSESWRDLGTPIYRPSFLKAVLAAFPDNTRICVVYAPDGTPAAGAFDGIHNDTVEGMWLGMRSIYRQQLVGYVLYWELIKDACEQGFRTFHLGRSSRDSGGEQFKKKWNADLVPLYWHYLLKTRTAIPSLNPDNPKYRLAINTWRKLPVPMTQTIGPFIARSIP